MSKNVRWIVTTLVVVGSMLLASCGPQATPEPTEMPTEPPAEEPTEPPEEPTEEPTEAPTEPPEEPTPTEEALAPTGEIDCMGAEGGTVTMIGVWSGEEEGLFMSILQPFLDKCDVELQYEGTRDLAVYSTRIEGGNPPDISGLPNPGLLSRYQEYMVPLADVVPLDQYGETWTDLGTMDGTVYGAFFKADTKSLVWYSPVIFEAQGWETPENWDQMETLMDEMAGTDTQPWSCGMESGDATGWVASDWIQDFLLRTEGAEFVEQWVDREIPWTDPAIKNAWEQWKNVCGSEEYAVGGAQGTINTTFQDSIRLVFQEPPDGYMVRQALFARSIIADNFGELEPVDDYNFFMFPQLNDEIGAPMQGGADVMAMYNEDNQAAVAMMNYMFGETGQRAMARTGWGLSPNDMIDVEDYPSELQGKAAELMNQAPAFSFDADDRMPGGLNVDYWQGTVDYLTGGDLDTILQNLEEAAAEAYGE